MKNYPAALCHCLGRIWDALFGRRRESVGVTAGTDSGFLGRSSFPPLAQEKRFQPLPKAVQVVGPNRTSSD